MPKLSLLFRARGYSGSLALTPPVGRVQVERLSRLAAGGPGAATLKASGTARDLVQWLEWLVVKAEIYNELGSAIWWGYIGRVEVSYDQVRISADVEPMANKVAVAFTLTSVGEASSGERGTTSWVEDADSIALFGIKERLLTLSDTTLAGAEAERDQAIGALSRGQAGYELRNDGMMPMAVEDLDQPATATIYCFGWWSTLAWRYAVVPTELVAQYGSFGTLEQPFGDTSISEIAQAVDLGAAVAVQQIGVYVKKIGAPADNLKVALCENPDDLTPGSELASATIAGSSLGSDFSWHLVTLSSPYAAAAGQYFLKLSRSGSQDAANYYVTRLDENQGYGAGPFSRKAGSSWATFAGDMPFEIYDNASVDTGQQVKSLLTAFAPYLRQVRLAAPSGVLSPSYRDGDSNVRYEVEKMMETGTSNHRRLLAKVNLDRSVEVYEQATASRPYQVDSRGRVFDPDGSPMRLDAFPAGVWLRPRDLPVLDARFLSGLQAFFLESVEYDALEDKLSWQPANLPDPWKQGVRRG